MSNLNNWVTQDTVQELGGLFLSVTGGGVFYVGTSAQIAAMQTAGPGISQRLFSSVNAALTQCVSGRGDVIYVLPGYTETIGAADAWSNLSATDVSIIGMGRGTNRPAFTWSIATSTVLFDTANFRLYNCQLNLEPTTGTVTVAAPITVSAAGCAIMNCWIATGTDANNKVTIGVTTTAAATSFEFGNNRVRGAAAATMTTFLRLVGVANAYIHDNDIICGTSSAAVGPIQELTTACTFCNIRNNFIHNNGSGATACITMDLASTTGWIANNYLRNQTDASNAQIVVTSGDVQLFENYGVNNSNERGIILNTASA